MADSMSLLAILREKAGDGTTDCFVEIRQSTLAALLSAAAPRCPCGAALDKPCANPNCHLRTGFAPGGAPLASEASAPEGRFPNPAENLSAGVGEARPAEPGEEA